MRPAAPDAMKSPSTNCCRPRSAGAAGVAVFDIARNDDARAGDFISLQERFRVAGQARTPRNQRRLGNGSHRSGSQSTKADQPTPSSTPPRTSLGQWSPAHTLARHVSTITTAARIQRIGLKLGLILGAIETASMKLIQVKNTACPLG